MALLELLELFLAFADYLWIVYVWHGHIVPSKTGNGMRPWLGYLLLLEDTQEVRRPVATSEPFFPVDEAFRGTSYKERYEIFCRRLVEERLYDAACFVTLIRDPANPIEEPASGLTFVGFAAAIQERARALLRYGKSCEL